MPEAAAPFDAAARTYDADFTATPLARELRGRVWTRLDTLYSAGDHVLELACGTGEDARHLAQRGVQVVATDQSPAMLDAARAKAAGLPIQVQPFNLLTLAPGEAGLDGPFDGVFSNFGGLNALADYAPLAGWLAVRVRPGGRLLFIIMGRWCAWEIVWHLAHGRPGQAVRRLRPGGAPARLGAAQMTVHYPSTTRLRRAFRPGFELASVRPLGLLLPPSYLEPLTRRRYFPWRGAVAADRRARWPLWADHTVYEFVRRDGRDGEGGGSAYS
ncbi:MAG: class I SAM-dependent methyltransferase [Anaerolineales bacterium]